MSSLPRVPLLAASLIVVATTLAYLTSFHGAFVFDDIPGIANNPTIRDLTQPHLLLEAIGPRGGTLAGRPVPNLTLALNYAMSGLNLRSYHATNLIIHLAAALTLFGLVRRTFLRPVLAEKLGAHALPLALVIALLWALHPLQTESVTYLVQRVESLMGLFFLLTLYCFVRACPLPGTAAPPSLNRLGTVSSSNGPRSARWFVASYCACLLGMGSKEVMVSAPLIVLIYDRIFISPSWRELWQRRRGFHSALFSTWVVLAILVMASGGRGGTAGLGTEASPWHYALTQSKVILAYLKLALWPHPLVFDYHLPLATTLAQVWPHLLALIALIGAVAYILIRHPRAGFLGLCFFAILAPTSSVVPIDDAMVEHRMYLPLAAVIAAVVLAVHGRLGRAALPLWAVAALVFSTTTAFRNLDYSSPQTLWEDVVRKRPENARAHNNLGAYLLEAGRIDEARARFETASRLDPHYASAHYNLGNLLLKANNLPAALAAFETAVRANPKFADARVNLGTVLDRLGRPADAIPHYEAALLLDPDAPDIHAHLGAALLKMKLLARAIDQFKAALALDPARPDVWLNLARAHQQQTDPPSARRAAERALQLKPDFPEALYLLGNLAAAAGDFSSAIARFERATEISPDYIAARNNLANALLVTGQIDAAIAQYRHILSTRPDDRAVQENLARALQLKASNPR